MTSIADISQCFHFPFTSDICCIILVSYVWFKFVVGEIFSWSFEFKRFTESFIGKNNSQEKKETQPLQQKKNWEVLEWSKTTIFYTIKALIKNLQCKRIVDYANTNKLTNGSKSKARNFEGEGVGVFGKYTTPVPLRKKLMPTIPNAYFGQK